MREREKKRERERKRESDCEREREKARENDKCGEQIYTADIFNMAQIGVLDAKRAIVNIATRNLTVNVDKIS